MNNKPILIFYFLLLLLNFSCEYEPKGVFEREVKQNFIEPIFDPYKLNIKSINDTIYFYSPKREIIFNFDNLSVVELKIFLDKKNIGTFSSHSGLINLDLLDGIHLLEFEIITKSGSNSIADNVNLEGFKLTKNWTIVVNSKFSPIHSTEIENGFLKIKIDPYLDSDFKEYKIYKLANWYDNENRTSSSHQYIDKTYFGEKNTYYIKVITTKNLELEWGSISLDQEKFNFEIVPTNKNQFFLKWSKPKYFGQISSYILQMPGQSGFLNNVKNTSDLNDTTFLITNKNFGGYLEAYLQYNSKEKSLYTPPYIYNFTTRGFLGNYFKIKDIETTNIIKLSNSEFLYFGFNNYYNNVFYRYTLSDNKQLEAVNILNCKDCLGYNTTFSRNGEYILYGGAFDENIYLTSEKKLSDYKSFNIRKLLGTGANYPIPIADNGFGILRVLAGLYIYDFKTGKLSNRFDGNYFKVNLPKISPNGKFIIAYDTEYKLCKFDDNNNSIELLELFPENKFKLFYDFDNNNNLVHFDGHFLYIKNTSNLEILKQIKLEDQFVVDIDYINSELLTYSDGHLKIRSLNNGELLQDIKYDGANFLDCKLINRNILTSSGLIYIKN